MTVKPLVGCSRSQKSPWPILYQATQGHSSHRGVKGMKQRIGHASPDGQGRDHTGKHTSSFMSPSSPTSPFCAPQTPSVRTVRESKNVRAHSRTLPRCRLCRRARGALRPMLSSWGPRVRSWGWQCHVSRWLRLEGPRLASYNHTEEALCPARGCRQ